MYFCIYKPIRICESRCSEQEIYTAHMKKYMLDYFIWITLAMFQDPEYLAGVGRYRQFPKRNAVKGIKVKMKR